MTAFRRFSDIPRHHYNVVLADFPWVYSGDGTKDQAAAKHYDCLTVDEMVQRFPLSDIMSKRGVAFLWATSPKMDAAIDLIRSNGLHYRGMPFVWVKTTADGRPIGAQGVRPSIVKPVVEVVLAASKVRDGRPLKILSEKVRQVVMAPRVGHSVKPTAAHERIFELYGNVTRIELFARRRVFGWDAFGDDPALFQGDS